MNEVAQGRDCDRVSILLVVAFAFGDNGSRTLRSKGLAGKLFCLQPVDRGRCLLGLELVLGIVDLMDYFEELGWHAILWELLGLVLHALVVEPSVAGMSDLLPHISSLTMGLQGGWRKASNFIRIAFMHSNRNGRAISDYHSGGMFHQTSFG